MTPALPESYAPDTAGYRAAVACIRAWETGHPTGGYGAWSDREDDAGGPSFGWVQFAERGALGRLIERYIAKGGRAADFTPFLPKLRNRATDLRGNAAFKAACIATTHDPLMREAQDELFREDYGVPAATYAAREGFRTALAYLTILDTFVQSGPAVLDRLRRRFAALSPARWQALQGKAPTPERRRELEGQWVRAYVAARTEFLKELGGAAAKSTYRPRSIRALLDAGNFELTPPFAIWVGSSRVTIGPEHVGPNSA